MECPLGFITQESQLGRCRIRPTGGDGGRSPPPVNREQTWFLRSHCSPSVLSVSKKEYFLLPLSGEEVSGHSSGSERCFVISGILVDVEVAEEDILWHRPGVTIVSIAGGGRTVRWRMGQEPWGDPGPGIQRSLGSAVRWDRLTVQPS